MSIQDVAIAYHPPLEQNCEIVEEFHSEFQIPRKFLHQKTSFREINRKRAGIFLMEAGGTNTP